MIGAGWFLENAWLIPVIPGIAFAVIILFGKRLPMAGLRGRRRLDGGGHRARRRHGRAVDPAQRRRR